MADSNLEYWRKREQAQLEANLREEETYSARLDAQFSLLERTIDQLIADFYQRYAIAEGISLADAQQRISKADIDALAEKAKRYVELASQDRRTGSNQSAEYLSKMANDEMRLYNAMMRINRLELLKAEIGMEVDQTYLQAGGTMDAALTKRTDDELRRQAGILGSTVFHNKEDVAAIVNGSFHNATFDQYIWKDCTALKSNLDILLTQGLIAGDNPRELARRLRKTFTASRYEAERLMRTELARVQTDAQKMSYERNGYDRYMFISTEDSHTCDRCSDKEKECIEKDGFLVKDMEIGENAPPMHPNCRCSTAAHMSEADFEREMMERFGVDMRDGSKSVELPRELWDARNIPDDIKQGIAEAIDIIQKQYNVQIDEIEYAPFYENEKAPFTFVPYENKGKYNAKLNINSLFDWNDSLDSFNNRIYTKNYQKGTLSSKNLTDLIRHEAAHFMTFQECNTWTDFLIKEREIRREYIPGVSRYNEALEDGSETIAEGFVRINNGENVSESVKALVERETEKYKK